MADVSDEIKEMSTSTPLTVAPPTTFESPILYLGDYSSLSFVGYSDQITLIVVEYSGNGRDFDYVLPYTMLAAIPFQQFVPIVAKYVKLTLAPSANQTILRWFTYGSTAPFDEDPTTLASAGGLTLVTDGVGPDLEICGLIAGDAIDISGIAVGARTITNTSPATSVTLDSAGGSTLVTDGFGPDLEICGLTQGTGITISAIAAGARTITNDSPATSVVLNSAGGSTLVTDAAGPVLEICGLSEGAGITISAIVAGARTIASAAATIYGTVRMQSNTGTGRNFTFPVLASASEILPTSAAYVSTLSSSFTNPSGVRLLYDGTTRNFIIEYACVFNTGDVGLIQLTKNGSAISNTDLYVVGSPVAIWGSTIQSIADGDEITIIGGRTSSASTAVTVLQLSMFAL